MYKGMLTKRSMRLSPIVSLLSTSLFFVFCLLATLPAAAQVDDPADLSLSSGDSLSGDGISSVHLANQSLSLSIPIIAYPQRGGDLNLSVALTYKNIGLHVFGSVHGDDYSVGGLSLSPSFLLTFDSTHIYSPSGTHPLYNVTGLNKLMALDGSGYTVRCPGSTSSSCQPQVISRGGIVYDFDSTIVNGQYVPDTTSVKSLTDRDGNQMTLTRTGDQVSVADSVGRQINIPTVWNSSVSSPQCPGSLPSSANSWTLPGPDNTSLVFTVCVGQLMTTDKPSPGQTVTSLKLPDGRQWTFDYDSNTGDLTRITSPTGKVISYEWTDFSIGMTQTNFCDRSHWHYRSITRRTVMDGQSPEKVWTYSMVPYTQAKIQRHDDGSAGDSYGAWYTVREIDPESNLTEHVFGSVASSCTFREMETNRYQGSSSTGSRLLSTVQDGYDGFIDPYRYYDPNGNEDYLPFAGNVWKTYHVFFTPSFDYNETATESYTYPQAPTFDGGLPLNFHQPSQIDHIGFNNGSSESQVFVWQGDTDFLLSGLVDEVASATAADGTSVVYAHDEPNYMIPANVSIGHQGVPLVKKGHVTTETRTSSVGNSTIATHTLWYDTGTLRGSINGRGFASTTDYDSLGFRPVRRTFPRTSSSQTHSLQDHIEFFAFESVTGRMMSRTDENGASPGDPAHSTTYRYNQAGDVIGIRGPSPSTTSSPSEMQYCFVNLASDSCAQTPFNDSAAPLNSVLSALNLGTKWQVIRTEFDAANRPLRSILLTDPSGPSVIDRTYDIMGRLHTKTNPHRASSLATDGTTFYWYDALGRPTVTRDQQGNFSRICYNGVSIVNSSGQDNCSGSSATANPLGDAFETVETFDPLGKHKLLAKDEVGNIDAVLEPDPHNTLAYQTLIQRNSTGAATKITQFGRVGVDVPRVRTIQYGGFGDTIAEYHPELGDGSQLYTCPGARGPWSVCFTYDNNDNESTRTDAMGITITYSLDALDRVTGKAYTTQVAASNPVILRTPPVTYFYDDARTGKSNLGHRTGIADGAGFGSWNYDSLGNIIDSHRNNGSAADDYETSYNPDGSVSSDSDGSYTYDGAGRVTSRGTVSTVDYWPDGARKSEIQQYGNGLIRRTYDRDSRLQLSHLSAEYIPSGTAGSTLSDFSYAYYADGKKHVVQNNVTPANTQTFYYDALSRLASVESAQNSSFYTYDPFGNLLSKSATPGTVGIEVMEDLQIDQNNRVSPSVHASTLKGELSTDGINSFVYDAESRLSADSTAVYFYDGDGARAKRVPQGGQPIHDFYTHSGDRYYIYDENTGDGTQIRWVFGEPFDILDETSGNSFSASLDQLGSTRVVIGGDDPAAMYEQSFTPWGETVGTPQTSILPYTYAGYEQLGVHNLLFAGTRQYKPSWGRFTVPDPSRLIFANIADPQSFNLFSYARNNPVNNLDSSGLACGDGSYDNDRQCDSEPQYESGSVSVEATAVCTPCGAIADFFEDALNSFGAFLESSSNLSDADIQEFIDAADQHEQEFLEGYVIVETPTESNYLGNARGRDVVYKVWALGSDKKPAYTSSRFQVSLFEALLAGSLSSALHGKGEICDHGNCPGDKDWGGSFYDYQRVYGGSPYTISRKWSVRDPRNNAGTTRIRVWDRTTSEPAAYEILHLQREYEFRMEYVKKEYKSGKK